MNISVIFVALGATIIFGASPVAAKIAVSSIPVMDVALLRTVIGGAIALPLTLWMGIGLPRGRQKLSLLGISGFSGFVAFPLLFTWGVLLTSANHASMILALLPIFTGAIAMTWDRKRPQFRWWLGCIIALAGEGLLIFGSGHGSGGHISGQSSIQGDLLVLAGGGFASLGYVAGGRLQQAGFSAKGTTFWGVSIFALALLPLLPFFLDIDALRVAGFNAWASVIYIAIGVTIIGYILWYWALGKGGIARIGLLQFLQPISGVILAWFLLAEFVSINFLIASSIIILGVWIAFRNK